MPNIVTNHIVFATEHDCERARSMMATAVSDFDFNAIIPMPKELILASSTKGNEAIAHALSLDVDVSEERIKETLFARLPNVPAEDLDELAENIASALSVAHLSRCDTEDYALDGFPPDRRPLSFEAYGQQLLQNLENHGAKDWYDWSVEQWGVKWNADNVLWAEREVRFETAWDPVPDLMQELAQRLNAYLFYEYAEESIGPEAAGAMTIDPSGEIIACASPDMADEWDQLFFEQGSAEWLNTFVRTKGLEEQFDGPLDYMFGPYKVFLDAVHPGHENVSASSHAGSIQISQCDTFELFRDERELYFPGCADTEPASEELYAAIGRELPHIGRMLNSPTLDLLFEQHALGKQELTLLCRTVFATAEFAESQATSITRDDIVLEHVHENIFYALERSEDGTFTFWCPENDLVKRTMRVLDDANGDEGALPQLGEPVIIATSVVWPDIVSTWFPYYDTAQDEEDRSRLEWTYPCLQIEPIDPSTLPKRANLFRRNRKAYWTEQRMTQLASNTQQPPMQPEQIATVRNVLDDPDLNPHSMLLERLLVGPAFNQGEGSALCRNANTLLSGEQLDEFEEKYLITFHRHALYRVLGGDWDMRLITLLDRDADAFVTKRIGAGAEALGGYPKAGDLIRITVAALDPDLITGWMIMQCF